MHALGLDSTSAAMAMILGRLFYNTATGVLTFKWLIGRQPWFSGPSWSKGLNLRFYRIAFLAGILRKPKQNKKSYSAVVKTAQ